MAFLWSHQGCIGEIDGQAGEAWMLFFGRETGCSACRAWLIIIINIIIYGTPLSFLHYRGWLQADAFDLEIG